MQVANKERELEAAQREVQDLRDQADSLVSAPVQASPARPASPSAAWQTSVPMRGAAAAMNLVMLCTPCMLLSPQGRRVLLNRAPSTAVGGQVSSKLCESWCQARTATACWSSAASNPPASNPNALRSRRRPSARGRRTRPTAWPSGCSASTRPWTRRTRRPSTPARPPSPPRRRPMACAPSTTS